MRGELLRAAPEDDEEQLRPCKEVVPLSTWVLISKLKVEYTLMRGQDGSFNRNLAEFHDRKVKASLEPREGVASMDLIMDRSTGLWSRVFVPAVLQPNARVPVLVYFHGGSYAHSSANSAIYDLVCRRLSRACGAVVVSVNYRRSPEHRFPAAVEDGVATLRWLRRQWVGRASVASSWLPSGAQVGRCVLAGDSSGGNMVHHVGVAAAASAESLLPVGVCGHVLMIPMFGGEARTPSELRLDGRYFVTMKDRDYYWRLVLPEGASRDHPACNVFGPNADVEALRRLALPRSLVVVAGLDLTQDWQLEYVRGLKGVNKQVELLYLDDSPVGFFILPNTRDYYRVMTRIAQFVALVVGGGDSAATSIEIDD